MSAIASSPTEADLQRARNEVYDLECREAELRNEAHQLAADYRDRGIDVMADADAFAKVDRIGNQADEVERKLGEARGRRNQIAEQVGKPAVGSPSDTGRAGSRDDTRAWGATVAAQLNQLGYGAAVVDGSVDLPSPVSPRVVPDPHNPERVVDLLVNRQPLEGNSFQYLRQTARDNQAAPVADEGVKPTSTFTIQEREDRARVVAHLSEPTPQRLFEDHPALEGWLATEMGQGIIDTLESQLLNGDGTGENFTGVLSTAGIQTVVRQSGEDKLIPLRRARSVARNSQEQPTAWVLSVDLAEHLDLEREGTDGQFLSAGPGLRNILGDHPIVTSTDLGDNDALLADWEQVRLYVRENSRLDLTTSGTVSGVDLFATNQFVGRGEGRFGIAVLRPQAFIHVDVTEPA